MRLSIALLLPGVLAASFDYVIVGGGTCGLLLANRLSEDPHVSVAVIDPGGSQRGNEAVEDPSQWLSLMDPSSGVNWVYKTVPQTHVANRSIDLLAGRGIGGTSLINGGFQLDTSMRALAFGGNGTDPVPGMTYIRGDKAQFDAWEALGNPGWNWDTMFHYYKKVEKFFEPTEDQTEAGGLFNPDFHGDDGALHVGFTPVLQNGSFYGMAKEAWKRLGQALNRDVNGGVTEGFNVWPQTLDPVKNRRSDSATSFLWPVEERPNLQLVNGTGVRVLWREGSDPPEAIGVEYVTHANESIVVHADKEVVLSAGALRTPLILENSGVGNSEFLQELGIETVIHAPGVGENMIDQPNNPLTYRGTGEITIGGYTPYGAFITARDLFGKDADAVAEETKRQLPDYAEQVAAASKGALDAAALEKIFEIQHRVMFDHDTTIAEILVTGFQDQFAAAYWHLLPFSRGSVHLRSASDGHTPVIDPRYLHINLDAETQLLTARLAAQFWTTDPVSRIIDGPVSAVAPDAPDDEWMPFIRETLGANSHYLGTAAMMDRELGGVVDPEMRVYGADGLRVVDASMLPMQMSGHLTATLYAVAQRASDMIISSR